MILREVVETYSRRSLIALRVWSLLLVETLVSTSTIERWTEETLLYLHQIRYVAWKGVCPTSGVAISYVMLTIDYMYLGISNDTARSL